MKPVRILTDSGSDLPQNDRPNLTVLPLTVSFGDTQYQDGVNLSHQKFYELLIEGEILPTTSQPSPAQFEDAFQRAADAGETVIAITLSSKLSGTYQSACIAAQSFRDVYIVDSENATIGERVLVDRAFQLLDQGHDAASVAQQLEREKKEVCLLGLLDTLEYLKRSGRISRTAALMGGLLSVKPVIAIQDGAVVMLGKARGSRNGNNYLNQLIQNTHGIDFSRPYCLGYTGLSDALLQKYIVDSSAIWEAHTDTLPVSAIGGGIGTHAGPGAIAAAFFRKAEA